MNVEEYIESGILELYIAGLLTEDENLEVEENIRSHAAIKTEVEILEKAILFLTASFSPLSNSNFKTVADRLNPSEAGGESKTIPLKARSNWKRWGWAAIFIALLGGLLWMLQENNRLNGELFSLSQEKDSLLLQISEVRKNLDQNEELLTKLREKDIVVVELGGQSNFEEYYAKAYWNKKEQQIYLDVQGLPTPPEGMVYQIWSLTLNPLQPTSIGLLKGFQSDEDKIFNINNPHASEAFGITLEPEGGSESPTMEQLYTLGIVPAS